MEMEYALASIGIGLGLGMYIVTRPTKEQRELKKLDKKKLDKKIARDRFLKYKREYNPNYSETSLWDEFNDHLVVPVFVLSVIAIVGTKLFGLW